MKTDMDEGMDLSDLDTEGGMDFDELEITEMAIDQGAGDGKINSKELFALMEEDDFSDLYFFINDFLNGQADKIVKDKIKPPPFPVDKRKTGRMGHITYKLLLGVGIALPVGWVFLGMLALVYGRGAWEVLEFRKEKKAAEEAHRKRLIEQARRKAIADRNKEQGDLYRTSPKKTTGAKRSPKKSTKKKGKAKK
jgi:hypothetical protein